MLRYIIVRMALFVPSLLLISVLTFWLTTITPGDPVQACFDPSGDIASLVDYKRAQNSYINQSKILNKDLAAFYFSILPQSWPDTLHRIIDFNQRQSLSILLTRYPDWPQIQQYKNQISTLEEKIFHRPNSYNKTKLLRELRQLKNQPNPQKINSGLDSIIAHTPTMSKNQSMAIKDTFYKIKGTTSSLKSYLPKIVWNGTQSQYHQWLIKAIQGDFGWSCSDQQPVSSKLTTALKTTITINTIAIFLIYLIAIPLGIWSAAHHNSPIESIISNILFVLFAFPVFWIATLLLIFFATPDYNLQLFPGIGLGDTTLSHGFFNWFIDKSKHLALPLFCLIYPGIAFISRQVKSSIRIQLNSPYIKYAQARGIAPKSILYKHAWRNSLLPVLTIFSNTIAHIISGSVVIEVIFNIPGMGKLAFDSIISYDWNVVYAILILSASLTIIGILLADILYVWADPRLKLSEHKRHQNLP